MSEIKLLTWETGAHTPFMGEIFETLKMSAEYSMHTTQFFMGNPKGFKRTVITENDISECKKLLERCPMHVFTHFPYIANLAGSKNQLAWAGDSKQDGITRNILSSLEYELSVMARLSQVGKTVGTVIHPGNNMDRPAGLKAISKSINKMKFTEGSLLLLENSAGQGSSLATTLEELKEILNGIDSDHIDNIGICIDTDHLFAYGEYNLSSIKEFERFFSDFDNIIGLDKLKLIHLNDSATPQKSRKDRHACLGQGYIWNCGFESLLFLMEKCKELGIPSVLETHGSDMLTLACLNDK